MFGFWNVLYRVHELKGWGYECEGNLLVIGLEYCLVKIYVLEGCLEILRIPGGWEMGTKVEIFFD